MAMLVTLTQARDHLRSDATADDTDLELKIKAASRAVLTYLKPAGVAALLEVDSSGDPIEDSDGVIEDAPEDLQLATLLLIGVFYRDREGTETANWTPGYLPGPVISLLYPYRDPALE